MNDLYKSLGGNAPAANQNVIARFNQFRQSFQGDPKQAVQNLLNSGRISQEQYNQAVQIANSLKGILG